MVNPAPSSVCLRYLRNVQLIHQLLPDFFWQPCDLPILCFHNGLISSTSRNHLTLTFQNLKAKSQRNSLKLATKDAKNTEKTGHFRVETIKLPVGRRNFTRITPILMNFWKTGEELNRRKRRKQRQVEKQKVKEAHLN